MTAEEHELMYAFIRDFWQYLKEFWVVNDSDEWWDKAITTADRMADKYNTSQDVAGLTRSLLITTLEQLDEKNKRARKEGKK